MYGGTLPGDQQVQETIDHDRLCSLGFADQNLAVQVEAFQAFHKLAVDGVIGSITRRHLDAPRVCAVKDLAARGAMARWDSTRWNGTRWVGEPEPLRLKWALAPGVDRALALSINWAWEEWEKVCAISAEYVDDPQQADVVFTHERIDGPSGTLAWAQLPFGPDRKLESRIDKSENWHLDPTTPPVRGRIHLGGVMCHEIGHLLGLEHDTTPARSLLDPSYGPDVLTPQGWDIAQAQKRYGPPIEKPAPTPGPTNPTPRSLAVRVQDGSRTYEGSISRVS